MTRAAAERLGRLLAIVPWIAAHDGPAVSEVCSRFGVSEADLLADLDLLFLCGVHPFTPDTLIEVDVADGRVWVRFADWFRRPLRLTPAEGLAVLLSGRLLLAVPGADASGALARALSKLEGALGLPGGDAVEVELAPVEPAVLAALRTAEAQRRRVLLDYYSFGRDRWGTRTVHPWKVFAAAGQWYLRAWCEEAGGERLFRVDRIAGARLAEGTFEVPAGADRPAALFHPDPSAPAVTLELDPEALWIAERYPTERVDRLPGGRVRVVLRAGERAWLERVLLRAGPAARVVDGDASLAPAAAQRILARYG